MQRCTAESRSEKVGKIVGRRDGPPTMEIDGLLDARGEWFVTPDCCVSGDGWGGRRECVGFANRMVCSSNVVLGCGRKRKIIKVRSIEQSGLTFFSARQGCVGERVDAGLSQAYARPRWVRAISAAFRSTDVQSCDRTNGHSFDHLEAAGSALHVHFGLTFSGLPTRQNGRGLLSQFEISFLPSLYYKNEAYSGPKPGG